MELTLDNERLRKLVPGIIHEVSGETPLHTKILPWLESSKQWLEDNILGKDFEPKEHGLYGLAEKAIVYRAMAAAVPALDVVLSPAGYAVINTDGRAPASKERVERLISAFESSADSNIAALQAALCKIADWRASDMGRWWTGTLMPTMTEAYKYKGDNSLLETYKAMRRHALRYEEAAAENYLGAEVTRLLREIQFAPGEKEDLVTSMREAELRYAGAHLADTKNGCPDEHEIWHLTRPTLYKLAYYADLHAIWEAEMGEKLRGTPFKNDRKGGYFF